MNDWLLLIPIGVLVLVTAPAFAGMYHIHERNRRDDTDRDPKSR